jgi:hypothetical protein
MPRGPKGEKRPADVIGNAVHVMRIATCGHPHYRIAILIVPLLLGGCVSFDPKALAAHDDAKCQSYGAKPGDPAYVQCRAQLDAARTAAIAAMAAAPPPPAWQPSPGVYSGMWHP